MNTREIQLADKRACTGCSACADACPKSCITMTRDGLHAYPKINREQCVECKTCMRVCPSINPLTEAKGESQRYYACWHKDLCAIKNSTSGGAGSALAEYAIERGYYVAGIILTKEGKVKNLIAKTKDDILGFRGSKYVQSDSRGIYKECLKEIKDGHPVLFIGTPCQTEAMIRVLPLNLRDGLLTCSIICHGVNSPFVWSDYYGSLEKKYSSKIVKYNFRCKSHGWQKESGGGNLRVSYELASGKKKDVPSWRNLFHYWFGQHFILRSSCLKCQYRTELRRSDIVIGDFWNVEKVLDNMDTLNGVSVVITTTNRGEEFLHTNPHLSVIAVDAQKTKKVLKGFINRKSEEIQNEEIKRAEDFELEYSQKGFRYMSKKYPNPTLFKQCVSKIKSMI